MTNLSQKQTENKSTAKVEKKENKVVGVATAVQRSLAYTQRREKRATQDIEDIKKRIEKTKARVLVLQQQLKKCELVKAEMVQKRMAELKAIEQLKEMMAIQ